MSSYKVQGEWEEWFPVMFLVTAELNELIFSLYTGLALVLQSSLS